MKNENRKIKVFLADDQEMITEGLKMLLSSETDIEVIGSARTGNGAWDKIKEGFVRGGMDGLPDVVVMDLDMPGLNGVDATRVLKRDFPMVKILILAASQDEENIFAAIKEGASGYLPKGSPAGEIARGVRVVADGGALMEPDMANRVLAKFVSISKGNIEEHSFSPSPEEVSRADASLKDNPDFKPIQGLNYYDLTERELDIAIKVSQGMNDLDIGNELYLSESTVKENISEILDKLDLHDRGQLAIFALKKLR